MKKTILTAMLIGMVGIAKAQWTFKKVDNGFDNPYKVAYTNTNNLGYLKMEKYDGSVMLYLRGLYFCGDDPLNIDISLFVNNEWQKYSVVAKTSLDKDIVWLLDDIANDKAFLTHFCNSTKMKIRVNMIDCDTEIYEFPMGNSARAYQFMKAEL